ncbi:MAG: hypothetical protein EXR79_05455 [Myxococcales bacterium]|nr:hypothetical protein [Myxococcales bacterium]
MQANAVPCESGNPCSAGACFIGGACYASGTPKPGNGCQRCVPSTAPDQWTLVGRAQAGFLDSQASSAM